MNKIISFFEKKLLKFAREKLGLNGTSDLLKDKGHDKFNRIVFDCKIVSKI